eukprot:6125350-Amphidinium_carterae.1
MDHCDFKKQDSSHACCVASNDMAICGTHSPLREKFMVPEVLGETVTILNSYVYIQPCHTGCFARIGIGAALFFNAKLPQLGEPKDEITADKLARACVNSVVA